MARLFLLILGIGVVSCGDDGSPRHQVSSDVELCVERQRALYAALRDYEAAHGSAPSLSGDAFLAELFHAATLADTPENRALLGCPGPGARALPAGLDLTTAPTPGLFVSSYAVRDQAAHPLTFPAGGPMLVLACESGNHEGVTNALFADGTVRTLEVPSGLDVLVTD